MNENLERIKVTLLGMLVILFMLVVVGIFFYLGYENFEFTIYKNVAIIMTVSSGIGNYFDMKYRTYEFNRNDNFEKLIKSKKLTELKRLPNITTYKIKSKYNIIPMKFSVSYKGNKVLVSGPKLIARVFKNHRITF